MSHRCILAMIVGVAGCCLFVGGASHAQAAEKTTYQIDPVHSTAIFALKHLGAGRFYGRFNEVTGTIKYADDSKKSLSFDVSIAVDSIDTNSDRLNGHLKSPDFFNEKEFPHITFKSKSAKKTDDHFYDVKGDLTLHGVTKTITVPVEWIGTADGRRGKKCGFEATMTLKRSLFGMSYGVGGPLGDDVRIIVSMEAGAGGGSDKPRRRSASDQERPDRIAQRSDDIQNNTSPSQGIEPVEPKRDET